MARSDSAAASSPRFAAGPIVAAFSGLWLAVLAASYLASDWTRNDFERFDNLWRSFLFFALFLAIALLYSAVWARGVEVSRRTLLLSSAAWLLLLACTFPVGSKDVFAYAFAGRIWHTYGANPYLAAAAAYPADPWQAYVQVWWREVPSAYGPVFLCQAWLADALAGGALWATILLHKSVAAACALASVLLAMRVGSDQTAMGGHVGPPLRVVLLAWNPLLLFESAGGAHNDAAMLLLVLGTIVCAQRGRWTAAFALLAVAFWYKWYSLLFAPPLLLELWRAAGARAALRQSLIGAAVGLGIGVAFLLPLPGSLPVIVAQLLRPGAMTEVMPTELSPPLAALRGTLRASGAAPDTVDRWFDVVRLAAFALAYVGVMVWQWQTRRADRLLLSCALIGFAFTLLLITILFPWHLLVPVGLGLASGAPVLVAAAVVASVLGLLSYFLTFAVAAIALLLVGAALFVVGRVRRAIA